MGPYAAVNGLKKAAGGYSRYFEPRVTDGAPDIERRKPCPSRSTGAGCRRCSPTAPGHGGNAMARYGRRMRVEQASDALENGPGGDRRRAGYRETARGRLVIGFVAPVLRCTMAAGPRGRNRPEPARSAVRSPDNVLAVGSEYGWRVLGTARGNRMLMPSFGIRPPGRSAGVKGGRYFPESVLGEVRPDAE